MEKTMLRQAVPLQPMEANGGADIHLQPVEDPTPEQGDAPEGGCDPWEAHAGASSWQDLWTHRERSPRQSRFAGRTCDPVEDPRWSSLFLKVCTPWERPMLEQGQSVRSPPPEEEEAAETTCDELTATPIPRPPVPLVGRERNQE
ncbi:AN1-type zinc finger protein 5-like [Grus japonensis]|uniref:AN1-type zinc finger protein 5-like n=1 Tax=Grus japonensis TaxID=30415 RepID=A0ABC9VUD9_GRUJA